MTHVRVNTLCAHKSVTRHNTVFTTHCLSRFFEIFDKYDGFKHGHVKLKRPKQLQEILDIARSLLAEIHQHEAEPEIEEKQGKLEQLKAVLEMHVSFIRELQLR